MTAHGITVFTHVAAGTLALTLFWINGVMKKGTPLHRRMGQAYLLSMVGVILSGIPLVFRLLELGQSVGAIFLTYLLVLVSNSCWCAWRSARDRSDYRVYYGGMFWSLAVITAASGIGVMITGFLFNATLLMVFGSIGVIGLVQAGFARRRAPHTPKWWLREHYGAMIGNGVATHIAFFAIGLRNALPWLDPAIQQNLAWFTPLTAAFVAGWWLNRKYGSPVTKHLLPVAPVSSIHAH